MIQGQAQWQPSPHPLPPVVDVFTNDQSTQQTTTFNVSAPAGHRIDLLWGDGESDYIICDGTYKELTHDYASTGSYTIGFRGHYDAITNLLATDSFISGTLATVAAALTGLTTLNLSGTGITGDISSLSGLTGMTSLYLHNTSVEGDIADISGLTALEYLYFTNCSSITGNISNLAGMTGLIYAYFNSTSVSGALSGVSGMGSTLQRLMLALTSVSGDIADTAGLTGLKFLYAYSTSASTYTSGALPPWSGNDIRIQSNGLDSTEVDNFLIDLADGIGTAGKLYIAGTNAARTAASDAAKAAILAAGWTVSVNE